MKSIALRGRLLKALALSALVLAPGPALAWWSHDWSYRKQIVVDAGPQGANLPGETSDVPVLIRLHEGVFKFTDANPDGADLRFIAEDDKTPLKFHIEKFDNVFNMAFVWVRVPQLKPGAPVKLWMYYGNPKAVAETEARDTYDPGQTLVWHFGERGAPPADSTVFRNSAAAAIPIDESGLIGNAAKFDGKTVLALPVSPSLAVPAAGTQTWSAWIKPDAADADAVLYAQREGSSALVVGLAKGVPYVELTGAGSAPQRAAATQALADKGWHHLAFVAGAELNLLVDGKSQATLAATLPALNGAATLGGEVAPAGAPAGAPPAAAGFVGEIDELEIAKVARPLVALQLAAGNQGTADKLVSFGGDEAMSSWSSGYVGIILGSVTLDGWVIIGILAVMALISWTVMARKGGQIRRVSKANNMFLDLFRTTGGDFGALHHLLAGTAAVQGNDLAEKSRELLRDSPLTKMFNEGIEELRLRLDARGNRSASLSEQSIEAIRATVDSTLVTETQTLNRQMVLLTIAIAGGPFIGLLGTVVGVMITFAAVAASGDVNINAIAPGIAAALAATVAGLFVAIPALFGYNYLITRIKEANAQMQVFVDAFITRLAENYNAPDVLQSMTE